MSGTSFLLSGSTGSIAPPPVQLGARTPRDTRAIMLDWSANLTPLGVTLASVVSIEVSRLDLLAMSSSDLVVSGYTPVGTMKVAIALSGGVAGTTYLLTCGITQSDGGVVYRSVHQPVIAPLG